MSKLYLLIPVLAYFFITSCNNDKDKSAPLSAVSNTDGSGQSGKVDTGGLNVAAKINSIYTGDQITAMQVPYKKIPSNIAYQMIQRYDTLSTPIRQDSVVKRIALKEDYNWMFLSKASKIKLFIALPEIKEGKRILTVLVQLKLRSGGYEYYDLGQPLATGPSPADVDPVFCPPPYPCATGPIED